jgi:hypothetical protein
LSTKGCTLVVQATSLQEQGGAPKTVATHATSLPAAGGGAAQHSPPRLHEQTKLDSPVPVTSEPTVSAPKLDQQDVSMQFRSDSDVMKWERAIKHVYSFFQAFNKHGHLVGDELSVAQQQKFVARHDFKLVYTWPFYRSFHVSPFVAGTVQLAVLLPP